jgi:hypothetical protein
LVRVVPVLAVLTLAALAACKAPPPKGGQAPVSSAPASSAPVSSAAPAPPAAPAHNWAYRQGEDYAYASGQAGDDGQPTLIRYLGQENGVYTVIETQQGAVVGASCARPCDQVRLRGQGLDQTLPLNPNSVVYAALTDAMNGQLDVYKPLSRPKAR